MTTGAELMSEEDQIKRVRALVREIGRSKEPLLWAMFYLMSEYVLERAAAEVWFAKNAR